MSAAQADYTVDKYVEWFELSVNKSAVCLTHAFKYFGSGCCTFHVSDTILSKSEVDEIFF